MWSPGGELVKESYQFRSPGHKGKPCRNAADVSHSNAAGIKKIIWKGITTKLVCPKSIVLI